MELIAYIIWQLPFSYFWTVNHLIPESAKTLLDIGCGKGELGGYIKSKRDMAMFGVDIYKPYIDVVRAKDTYDKAWRLDITKHSKSKTSYDVILFSQILEHFRKNEAIKIVNHWEKSATQAVIIGVPRGHIYQGAYDGNRHQRHNSSWTVSDLTKLGYKVYGQSAAWLYSGTSHLHIPTVLKLFLAPISYLTCLVYFYRPQFAAHLIAVKYIHEK